MARTRFPWRLFSRVAIIQAIVALVAIGASGFAARFFFKRNFLAQVGHQLGVTLDVLAHDLPAPVPPGWCLQHKSTSDSENLRLTVISPDGKVLCESDHERSTMENHATRPEVVEALRSGHGEAIRFSTTLSEDMFYEAFREPRSGVIMRGAIPLAELRKTLLVFDTSLALMLVLIGLITAIVAIWTASSLAHPIGRLLLKARSVLGDGHSMGVGLEDPGFGELSDLEDSLDVIGRDLEAKAERLSLQREEQAMLMSAISDSILAVDLEGAPMFYNSRFMLLFGSRVRGGTFRIWEIFRDPEIIDGFNQALRDGRSTQVKGIPFDQDDSRKFFSVSVSPLRRSTGVVYGAVGIFHDVTDLKRAEQIRIDFVANVSHELRTPLTAIKGYADTLRTDVESGRPAEKEFLTIIMRNTERLMSLINDLLDLSSLESNVDELHKSDVDVREITERVTSQLRQGFEAREQAVEVEAVVPTVLADPRRLEQVLVNLLDNARKYTPPGQKVTVRWEAATGPGGVLLKVIDHGPGVSREHQSRLFERFYRIDKARSRELGGTGLGLAIVKHIMQRHGGTVWVESEVGHGATFVCKFPGDAPGGLGIGS